MSYQVSVFLENKLGHLEKVTAILREAAVNIRSIHLNHTAHGWGILNLVVANPHLAVRVLNDGSSALFMIDIQDIPDAQRKLAEVGLNIISDERVYGG